MTVSGRIRIIKKFGLQKLWDKLFASPYEFALAQVINSATLLEKKSGPKRSMYAAIAGLLGTAVAAAALIIRARR